MGSNELSKPAEKHLAVTITFPDGFIVDGYQEALTLFTSAGYQLDVQQRGTDISIDTQQRLPDIKAFLTANNIKCEFSDIADTFYQA